MSVPQQIIASDALARGARYAGRLAAAELPRLQNAVSLAFAPLEVNLSLQRVGSGDYLRGSIAGGLTLACQRCDQRVEWPVDLRFECRLVHSEEEEQRLLADCDPYWVQEDRLPLQELVEDELLLALPMMLRCAACEQAIADAPPPVAVRESPFAQLKNLKNLK